jgi:HK97 family phage prohead protease
MFKQLSYEIKGVDNKGIVEAYANVYNVEDSDGDISATGSFKKTSQEQRKRIRVLKDHNPTMSLGVPLEIDANDPIGLRTLTQFNLEKQISRDMFSDIKLYMENGLNAELSIGYEVVKRSESNTKMIEEYKLYEYSFLTSWAANEFSTVQGVKDNVPNGVKSHYGIMELITKAYDMDYSDTRLKQIESILLTLSNEPSNHSEELAVKLDEIFNKQLLQTNLEGIFNGK